MEGRRSELRKRGTGSVFITNDNCQILLEKDTLINVSNLISNSTGKKMSQGEIELLVSFISEMPPKQFYGKSLDIVEKKLASIFINRYSSMVISEYEYDPEHTVSALQDYLNDEVKNFSKNEHPYKYSSHVSRSGSSVIGNNSSQIQHPEKIVSINDPAFATQVISTLNQANHFMSQKNIDSIVEKTRVITPDLQTFNNITLPRRIIPLDSRNRLLSARGITWNLHSAGHAGRLGDIRIQDTLCEIIQFKICPFWLPVRDSLVEYYGKVRMSIKELWQSAMITEFLDPLENIPTIYYYHIEFEIQQKINNRLYLVPICNTYTFSKPVARLETISLEFRSPFNLIELDPDRGIFNMTFSTLPLNPTLFTSLDTAHGLSTGDLVYIINASTSSTNINNLLNRTAGWIVTRINNMEFTIELDTSSLIGSESNIIVLYGSKRIILQVEFISLQH